MSSNMNFPDCNLIVNKTNNSKISIIGTNQNETRLEITNNVPSLYLLNSSTNNSIRISDSIILFNDSSGNDGDVLTKSLNKLTWAPPLGSKDVDFNNKNVSNINDLTVNGQATFTTPPHIPDPVLGNDAASKGYVDSLVGQYSGGFNLFMNYSNTAPEPNTSFKELSPLVDAATQQSVSISLTTNSPFLLTQFITSEIGITEIPIGLWDLFLYALVNEDKDTTTAYFELWKKPIIGVDLKLGTSGSSGDINNKTTATSYSMSLTISTAIPLQLNDRLYIKIYGQTNHNNTVILTTYYEGNSYSFLQTTLNAGTTLLGSNNNWTGNNTFHNNLFLGPSNNVQVYGGAEHDLYTFMTENNIEIRTNGNRNQIYNAIIGGTIGGGDALILPMVKTGYYVNVYNNSIFDWTISSQSGENIALGPAGQSTLSPNGIAIKPTQSMMFYQNDGGVGNKINFMSGQVYGDITSLISIPNLQSVLEEDSTASNKNITLNSTVDLNRNTIYKHSGLSSTSIETSSNKSVTIDVSIPNLSIENLINETMDTEKATLTDTSLIIKTQPSDSNIKPSPSTTITKSIMTIDDGALTGNNKTIEVEPNGLTVSQFANSLETNTASLTPNLFSISSINTPNNEPKKITQITDQYLNIKQEYLGTEKTLTNITPTKIALSNNGSTQTELVAISHNETNGEIICRNVINDTSAKLTHTTIQFLPSTGVNPQSYMNNNRIHFTNTSEQSYARLEVNGDTPILDLTTPSNIIKLTSDGFYIAPNGYGTVGQILTRTANGNEFGWKDSSSVLSNLKINTTLINETIVAFASFDIEPYYFLNIQLYKAKLIEQEPSLSSITGYTFDIYDQNRNSIQNNSFTKMFTPINQVIDINYVANIINNNSTTLKVYLVLYIYVNNDKNVSFITTQDAVCTLDKIINYRQDTISSSSYNFNITPVITITKYISIPYSTPKTYTINPTSTSPGSFTYTTTSNLITINDNTITLNTLGNKGNSIITVNQSASVPYTKQTVTFNFTTYNETINPLILVYDFTSSPDLILTLPISSNSTITELFIDWGDSTTDTSLVNHIYSIPGIYTVSIRGNNIHNLNNDGNTSVDYLTGCTSFGTIGLTNLSFQGCNNLISLPTTLPTTVTNLYATFQELNDFNVDISSWNVSNVTNMAFMFYQAMNFNQNISGWNVSNVTDMSAMFNLATNFNSNIGSWDVSGVLNMAYMFQGASMFNQNLNSWNVKNVTNMNYMFNEATSFNQNISEWNVIALEQATNMLTDSNFSIQNYNSLLYNWSIKNVKLNVPFQNNIYYSTDGIDGFNRLVNKGWIMTDLANLSDLPTTRFLTLVYDFTSSPTTTNTLHLPISTNDSNIKNLYIDWGDTTSNIFEPHEYTSKSIFIVKVYGSNIHNLNNNGNTNAEYLTSCISFGTVGLTNLSNAFKGCTRLTSVPSTLPTTLTNTSLESMFQGASSFNGNISTWDVTSITIMTNMFQASSFNRDISTWNVIALQQATNMLTESNFNIDNYNSLLYNWSTKNVKLNVPFQNNIYYSTDGIDGFNRLVNKGWIMTDLANLSDLPTTRFLTLVYDFTSSPTTTNTLHLPISTNDSNIKNLYIDWGDTTSNIFEPHEYTSKSIFIVKVYGSNIHNLNNNGNTNAEYLTSCISFGTVGLTNLSNAFKGCTRLTSVPSTLPTTLTNTSLESMFQGASSFNGNISTWDVTSITIMTNMFQASSFNRDISTWNVIALQQATNMLTESNFSTYNYDSLLSSWSTKSVQFDVTFNNTGLTYSEYGVYGRSILENTKRWYLGNDTVVEYLTLLYDFTSSPTTTNTLQLPISTNDSTINKLCILWGDTTISSILESHTYTSKTIFTVEIYGSNIHNLNNNGNIHAEYLISCTKFGTVGLTNLSNAFKECTRLTSVPYTIPSTVTNLESMFQGADIFNQDISPWDVTNIVNMTNMLSDTAFNMTNYDLLLSTWSTQNVKFDVNFNNTWLTYSANGTTGRNTLQNTKRWRFENDIFNYSTIPVANYLTLVYDFTQSPTTENTLQLPISTNDSSLNNFFVIWGDRVTRSLTRTYKSKSIFTGQISGTNIHNLNNNGNANAQYLTSCTYFGTVGLTNLSNAFKGCTRLTNVPTTLPSTLTNTSLESMFQGASMFDQDIGTWDVTTIVNMTNMFQGATSFNQNISEWNVIALEEANNMLTDSNFSIYNYDLLLSSWSNKNVKTNVLFQNNKYYSANGLEGFNMLVNKGWIMRDLANLSNLLPQTKLLTLVYDFTSSPSTTNTLQLPISTNDTNIKNLYIGWGDTTISNIFEPHEYTSKSTFTVQIYGSNIYTTLNNNGNANAQYLTSCISFGEVGLTNLSNAFKGCTRLTNVPTTLPSTLTNTSLESMFQGATIFNGNIITWDVTSITNMTNMFQASSFNRDISTWNVIALQQANNMLTDSNFNIDNYDSLLSSWSTKNVKFDVSFNNIGMVYSTTTGLNGRNTLQNTKRWYFGNDSYYDFLILLYDFIESPTTNNTLQLPISTNDATINKLFINWGDNTTNTTFVSHTYTSKSIFTVKIYGTNIHNLNNNGNANAQYLISCTYFGNVGLTNLSNAFKGCSSLTSVPTTLPSTLTNTSLESMFQGATIFNGKINITNTFVGDAFDQDISTWNVTNIVNMTNMFQGATIFNKNISSWNVIALQRANNMLSNTSFSMINYDLLLSSWSTKNVKFDVSFNNIGLTYSLNGFNGRNTLEDIKRWYFGIDTYSFTNDDKIKYIIAGTNNYATTSFESTTGVLPNLLINNNTTDNSFLTCYTSNGTNEWVVRIDGIKQDIITCVYVNSNNDIFISGTYVGRLNFYSRGRSSVGGFVPNHNSDTINDIFVAKYNAIGIYQWATRIGGTNYENNVIFANTGGPVSITSDNLNNVIVTGSFKSRPVNFYSTSNLSTPATTITDGDATIFISDEPVLENIFIVKYDSIGTVLWATRINGAGNDMTTSIHVDTSNNIIIGGAYYSVKLNFYNTGSSTTVVSSLNNASSLSNFQESFIAKYNPSGQFSWAARIGNAKTNVNDSNVNEYVSSICIDRINNICIAGFGNSNPIYFYNFNGNVGKEIVIAGTNNDAYVAKYNPNGSALWAARISGSANDVSTVVAADSSNNVIVAGIFNSSTLNFYNEGGASVIKTFAMDAGSSRFGTFLAKYSSTGTVMWATRINGSPPGSYGTKMLTIDPSNNIIIGGYSNSTIDTKFYNADTNNYTSLTNSSGTFGFIAKYNTNGIYQWGTKIHNIILLTSGSTMSLS
jgi:surface protein